MCGLQIHYDKLSFIGSVGQKKLSAAKVLVIGAGGLGCPCLQALAGCGIGTLGIADYDTVSLSNLHRQILYQYADIGLPKTAVAKNRLLSNNPFVGVAEHPFMVEQSNVLDILSNYDVVVDGTDNFMVRYLINDACVYLGKPLVYGAIYQTEGHFTVFNIDGSTTLRCLFNEPDAETLIPSCADTGAYNVVTHIIGTMMANEVVKVVLGDESVSVNKLVNYDALDNSLQTVAYKPKPESRGISVERFKHREPETEISTEEFLALEQGSYRLIDVREDHERREYHIGGLHLPLGGVSNYAFDEYAKADTLIVYCAVGQRSRVAAAILRSKGFVNTRSLKGGVNLYRQLY